MRRLTSPLLAALLVVVVATSAAWATEEAPAEPGATAPAGEHEEGEPSRIDLPMEWDNPEDWFSLAMFGVLGLAAMLGLATAVKQLRGERPKASGEWRPR